jgi:hypothetical protein
VRLAAGIQMMYSYTGGAEGIDGVRPLGDRGEDVMIILKGISKK